MKNFLQKYWLLLVVLIASLILFSPALNTFFFGDDWFHLYVIQIGSIKEFINFFDPRPNPQSISFYRPLSTQVFFYVFYTLFGLAPFFYHLFWFLVFLAILVLIYKVARKLGFDHIYAILMVFLFGFSHTNFTRLYFLSAGQELLMMFFVMLGLFINYSRKNSVKKYSSLAVIFILSLLSKESAIIFPVLVLLSDLILSYKISLKKFIPLGIILAFYLYIRFFVFGFDATISSSETYTLNFSPRVLLNTIYMYVIWALGGAELLQDYLRSPVQLIERYYTDFKLLGRTMLALLISFVILITGASLQVVKQFDKKMLLGLVVFLVGLLPFIFFPEHKFTIQMSVSMFGFAIFFTALVQKLSEVLRLFLILLFVCLNLVSIYLTYNTHYSIQRSNISRNVYEYIATNENISEDTDTVVFLNAQTRGNTIETWGSSKQISHALMGDNFFKVLYPNKALTVIYEDFTKEKIELNQANTVYFSSGEFIK